jgi:hypothetical protein
VEVLSLGQNHLSQLSDDELSSRLSHQYLLTFSAKAMNKAQFRNIKMTAEVQNADLAYADRVWVPAGE